MSQSGWSEGFQACCASAFLRAFVARFAGLLVHLQSGCQSVRFQHYLGRVADGARGALGALGPDGLSTHLCRGHDPDFWVPWRPAATALLLPFPVMEESWYRRITPSAQVRIPFASDIAQIL